MTRRYFNVEMKSLVDLKPGDRIVVTKTAEVVANNGSAVVIQWDDGSSLTGQLAENPALEVIIPTAAEKQDADG